MIETEIIKKPSIDLEIIKDIKQAVSRRNIEDIIRIVYNLRQEFLNEDIKFPNDIFNFAYPKYYYNGYLHDLPLYNGFTGGNKAMLCIELTDEEEQVLADWFSNKTKMYKYKDVYISLRYTEYYHANELKRKAPMLEFIREDKICVIS